MNLSDVHRGIRRRKNRKRIGRGPGSGHGKTAGRGEKGQKSRSGWSSHPAFEGGTMPLVRRVPKRGFNNRWASVVKAVNVGALDEKFAAGDEVNPETLREKSVAKGRYDVLKILGEGELTKGLKVAAHRFSKSAEEKIKQAGGEVIVLPGKKPVVKKPFSRTPSETSEETPPAPAGEGEAEQSSATTPPKEDEGEKHQEQ